MSKQERSYKTHSRMLDAAALEFARHGFAATNLSDVVSRTNLTKGALYGHFGSKTELAEALTRQLPELWRELPPPTAADSPAPVHLALSRRLAECVRFRAGLRLTIEETMAHREATPQLAELYEFLVGLAEHSPNAPDASARPLAQLVLALLVGACCIGSIAGPDERHDPVSSLWSMLS